MSRALWREPAPFVTRWRSRTVAEGRLADVREAASEFTIGHRPQERTHVRTTIPDAPARSLTFAHEGLEQAGTLPNGPGRSPTDETQQLYFERSAQCSAEPAVPPSSVGGGLHFLRVDDRNVGSMACSWSRKCRTSSSRFPSAADGGRDSESSCHPAQRLDLHAQIVAPAEFGDGLQIHGADADPLLCAKKLMGGSGPRRGTPLGLDHRLALCK